MTVQRLTLGDKEIVLMDPPDGADDQGLGQLLAEKPDALCLELCSMRWENILHPDRWLETDIRKVMREKRTALLFFQLLSGAMQKKFARAGVVPEDEILRPIITAAKNNHIELVPADREIRITLLRTWRRLQFFGKIKLLHAIYIHFLKKEKPVEEETALCRSMAPLELTSGCFPRNLPEVLSSLHDERCQYLAAKICQTKGRKIMAILGDGCRDGVFRHLGRDIDVAPLLEIPPAPPWGRLAILLLSFFITAYLLSGLFSGAVHSNINMVLRCSPVMASFSGLGAVLLLAHPLTIMASVMAAPITTIHPLIATGWVAGLTEVMVRKPKVADFLHLTEDTRSICGFFRNKITRIVLLITVVNLTTAVGTFLATPAIMRFF